MKMLKTIFYFLIVIIINSCLKAEDVSVEVYETAANGHKLTELSDFKVGNAKTSIKLNTNDEFQVITGFGGSFTEASASLLNRLSKENREKIIEAYFGDSGAQYSLTRTHINSCEFFVE